MNVFSNKWTILSRNIILKVPVLNCTTPPSLVSLVAPLSTIYINYDAGDSKFSKFRDESRYYKL